jgi:hypothetical protein
MVMLKYFNLMFMFIYGALLLIALSAGGYGGALVWGLLLVMCVAIHPVFVKLARRSEEKRAEERSVSPPPTPEGLRRLAHYNYMKRWYPNRY